MSEELDENIVPDNGVIGMNSPRLDADPVDDSFMAEFDKMDDAAQTEEVVPETDTQQDENFLTNGLTDTNPEIPEVTEPVQETVPEPVQVQPESQIDPEIAAIEQPRNLSESNQSNWKKLQETASRYKQEALEAQQLRQRLAEMQQSPVQAPQDYEELKRFKQIFDLKNDPEFHSKFEQPIKSATESIYSILKKNGASDETIASIQKVGGPEKVSETWWKQNVLDKLPLTDAERLKRNLVDVVDLNEKREQEIQHTAQYAEQILEERKNEKVKWFEQENQTVYQEVDQLTKDTPWARYREIPQNASADELAEIQRHNASVQDLHNKFNTALWPRTASERTRVAAAAVLSHKLVEQLKIEQVARNEMTARLQQLEAENSKLKMAGRAPKASANVTASNKFTNTTDRWKMNAGDAIDMGLDEAGA
jgi:hypothetical protein